MRTDVATILLGMGYVIDKDFIAYEDGKDSCEFTWLSHLPRPTERDIDTAAPAVYAAIQAQEVKRVESDTARTDAKQAYSELQPLIEHKDPAIALLAAIMQKHLLATLGR